MHILKVTKIRTWIADQLWYGRNPLRWLLLPFSWVYSLFAICRRSFLRRFGQRQFPVPIIIVGNLSVGGVGKTPLVIALAKKLAARGLRVGIVSRGYGAKIRQFPHEVSQDDEASQVGDEPLLLAKRAGCPVVISPRRVDAVQYLLDNHQSQIIVSDDGLQHYAMGRAVEIAVIDGVRGLGNGLCLPAGPLRESVGRLQQVDFIIVNGGISPSPHVDDHLETAISGSLFPRPYQMDLILGEITQLVSGKSIPLNELQRPIAAVAAIGHPKRFFASLSALGVAFKSYSFPDHYAFCPEDLQLDEKTIVMTEKDAVKCESFATEAMYFLPVVAQVEDKFWDALWSNKNLQGYI